jgi:hypothetical protein
VKKSAKKAVGFRCFYLFLPCKFGKNAWQGISFSEKHVGCEQIQLK